MNKKCECDVPKKKLQMSQAGAGYYKCGNCDAFLNVDCACADPAWEEFTSKSGSAYKKCTACWGSAPWTANKKRKAPASATSETKLAEDFAHLAERVLSLESRLGNVTLRLDELEK